MRPLRIGSRGSILARWQAESVRKQLFQVAGVEAEIIIIKTSGDKMQQAPLTQIGGKGIFIKELEESAAPALVVHRYSLLYPALAKEFEDLASMQARLRPPAAASRLDAPPGSVGVGLGAEPLRVHRRPALGDDDGVDANPVLPQFHRPLTRQGVAAAVGRCIR